MLDLKRLNYLVALYRHRSFTKASEELFVTQPAISLAVKALEEHAGVQLLDHQAKGVVFTQEGEQYVLHAQHILQECEKTETVLQALSSEWQQTLHLGISPTLGMNLQKYICSSEFRKRFPLLRLSVEEDSMNVQIEKIRRGTLQLSFNALPQQDTFDDLVQLPISSASVECVMRPDHPLANQAEITLADLNDVEISSLGKNFKVYFLIMKAFEEAGVTPQIHSFHEQILCMLNTVILGNFVGFVCVSGTYIREQLRRLGLVLRKFDPELIIPQGFIYSKKHALPQAAYELMEITRTLEGDSPPGAPL